MTDLKSFRDAEFARRETRLTQAERQILVPSREKKGALRIVYVMTHVGICGGTKIILEHVNHLSRFGQKVAIVSHFDKPTWFPMDSAVRYIKVPLERELALGIPPCDVIVATYWREIYECIARKIAPVVYFEQGDYHLFDWESVSPREKSYIYRQFQLVPFIYTVSAGASEQIEKIFGRKSKVINNAVDRSVFHPGPAERVLTQTADKSREYTLMMIGSESNESKGIEDIKKSLPLLEEFGYRINLVWVSPDQPSNPAGRVFVNPEQRVIGQLLRSSDFFVCGSLYESFSLPVLEAMACGCAVVTTRNKGVTEYAEEGKNCLMAAMGDPNSIAEKVALLIEDEKLRQSVIAGGLKTAARYTWSNIIPRIINYYRLISSFTPVA